MRLASALLLFGLIVTTATPIHAATPDYLREAVSRFSAEVPAGWAYTVTTTRGDEVSVERFDPSRPRGGEWTLLQRNGQAATAEDIERYRRYKAGNAPTGARATFERGDLDVESAELLREDGERAEFQVRFRGDIDQPLLAHVFLELSVRKSPAAVERSVLRLFEPFAPAMGVRMHELAVTTLFAPPTDEAPPLPLEVTSRFRGRMFFLVPINEDVRLVYADFARVK
ncbi:MAG: hypothetical protein C0518_13885 [Opitutus sp.]|nr:hypothetical protein [Opitutus sp.]